MHAGPIHPHIAQKLPQFQEPIPLDINEMYDLDMKNREEYEVIYESHPDQPVEEFADLSRNIDDKIEHPYFLTGEKTHTYPKANMYAAK